tara:strand:+ start:886 stop:5517 length:4632 start_codon:yes stop_codon:yes gene_type:complete
MADFRLGRLKFKWKGDWTASTAYVIDDIVKYGANSYVCKTNHTSDAAITNFYANDISKWDLHTEGIINKGAWAASTWYKINDVVKYGNTQYRVTAGHTSGATFSDTNLTVYLEGLKYENTWVANTAYQVGDIVTYGGYSYSAKTNHSSATVPNSDTTNWAVLTVGFEARGEWATGTTYKLGDVVRYGGNSYVNKLTVAAGGLPTDSTYWTLLAEGFNWTGNWVSSTAYKLGDVVNRTSNSYVCIQAHTGQQPENDSNGTYWNYVAQGGAAAQVLTTTGDLLYQSAGGIARIGLPAGSTGTAAQQAVASGQVLTVGGSPLLPRWEQNNVSAPVYYVTKEGSDTNSGKQISRGFASLRYACDTINALTGADAPSLTNPISIYMKAGIYEEQLPIQIPPYVSVLGDNIRTTQLKPKSGNSDMQAVVIASAVTHLKMGDTVSNSDGTKTAKILDSDHATNVHLLPVTGGAWTTSDKYVDIVSNKHADGKTVIDNNAEFLAWEAYHRYAAAVGTPAGVEAEVKNRLQEFATDLGFNVKHGANNKIWDYTNTLLSGTAITGTTAQDKQLITYLCSAAVDILEGNSTTISAGNTKQITAYTGTADTASPKCATVVAAVNTLRDIFTTSVDAGNMSGTTKTDPYINVTSAGVVTNANSTFMYLGDHTIIKDLVMSDLVGFVPNGSNDKDIDGSTIKGVYFRLDPDSAITKSPYVQNCSALGGAGVGAFIDGNSHKHFDNSPTPSFKSACFDAYTQVLEGGVGVYCKGTAAVEAVSSFTYYCHISYAATGGARIRAVSGNSSYGKYGCISRGFDAAEATKNGKIEGLRIEVNPAAAKSGTWTAGERFTGGTSNAVGELRSDQIEAANYIYYFPVTGTFQNGELITGATSSATATLAASNAISGQKGFTLIAEGLSTGPDQGGSIELVDNGSNNDPGSFVISKSSYTAPDGRGSLTVSRAELGTTAAAHQGTDTVALFPSVAGALTLSSAVADTTGTNINVNAVTGIVQNGHLVIGNELMKVTAFVDANNVTVQRGVEGSTATTHSNGAAVAILGVKAATQDEVIEDITNSATKLRVAQAGVSFKANDYIRVDNELMKLSAAAADTTGIVVLSLTDEKAIACGDGQDFKIRYRYSQVRLTAHDFLDVGTGNRTTTNWPYLPTQVNVPSQEIDEDRPGRVYYVSTDQDGNFSVGNYFKVEQSTGKATLNASAFDLTGLDTLRLGAIGAQLGATIDEFSTDGTLTQNSDEKVPTQKAVKTYVDSQTSGTSLNFAGGSGTGTIALGSQSLTVQGTANEIETSASSQTLTLGLPNNVTIGNNLTVTGDLTVNGATTTVSTTNTTIADKLLELGNGVTGTASGDAGIVIERGSETNVGLFWDESEDKFVFASGGITGTSTGDLTFNTERLNVDVGAITAQRLITNEVVERFTHETSNGLNTQWSVNLANTSVVYYDVDSSGNWQWNVRGDGSTTLDSMMASGEVMTASLITDHGGTAHYMNGFLIDGTDKYSTIHWAGGSAPTQSDAKANGVSVYMFSILKTGSNTYKILGSFTSYED